MDDIVVFLDCSDEDDCHAASSAELLGETFVEISVYWKAGNLEGFRGSRDDAQHCDIEFSIHLLESLVLDAVVLEVSPTCCNLRNCFG